MLLCFLNNLFYKSHRYVLAVSRVVLLTNLKLNSSKRNTCTCRATSTLYRFFFRLNKRFSSDRGWIYNINHSYIVVLILGERNRLVGMLPLKEFTKSRLSCLVMIVRSYVNKILHVRQRLATRSCMLDIYNWTTTNRLKESSAWNHGLDHVSFIPPASYQEILK